MAHGMDMQGRNVMAVHLGESGQHTFGENFTPHHIVDIAHRAGSMLVEQLSDRPVSRFLASAGAVLHLS